MYFNCSISTYSSRQCQNRGAKTVIPQRSYGQFLVQLQQKQFRVAVKAVQLSAHLTNGCQHGNWWRNETFMKFRIFTNFTGSNSEDPQDLSLTKYLKSQWRPYHTSQIPFIWNSLCIQWPQAPADIRPSQEAGIKKLGIPSEECRRKTILWIII